MKKSIIIFLALFFGIIVLGIWICGCIDNTASSEGRKRNFNAQLGTYVLDIHKTTLGTYRKDSSIYKNLTITFFPDSFFSMNMKVPFIYDTFGTWQSGNMLELNYLYYKNWKYAKKGTGEQFTRPDSSGTFLLYNATPQKGKEGIQEIYFKRNNHFFLQHLPK